MMLIGAIALGGALGAVARYLCVRAFAEWFGPAFPYGTLGVNVAGSFAAGVLYVLLVERLAGTPEWRALLMIGFLGAFTTFSAFSLETVRLIEEGASVAALSNILLNVVLCVFACAAAIWLGRLWS